MHEDLFLAYDLRGIVGQNLTEEDARELGLRVGKLLEGKKVCVGMDSRWSSPQLSRALIDGLRNFVDVIDIGSVPNPVLYFYSMKNVIDGIYVTASHNPPEYNGFKMVRPDGISYSNEYQKIKGMPLPMAGKEHKVISDKNAIKEYEEFIASRIKIPRKIKIVVECFGGAGSFVTPKIFEDFGIEVIPLNAKPDGHFLGLRPEPRGENLMKLKEIVVKTGADFGAAFDGDADRAVFVDDLGREMNGSSASIAFIRDILSRKKGNVVITIDCASELEKITKEMGGNLIWSRVGHGFIEETVKKNNALFGGEQSSHFYLNEFYPFSDGILSILVFSSIVAKSGERVSEIVDSIKLHPTDKVYINCGTHEKKRKVMEKIKKMFPEGKDFVDGIKIFLNDVEWVLIRTSQNLPEINLAFEALDEERKKYLLSHYSKIINDVISNTE